MERESVSMEETITIQPQSTLSLTLTHPVQGGTDEAGPSSGKKRASEPGEKDRQSKKPRLTEEDGDITLHVDHQAKVIDISIDGNHISSPLMECVKMAAIITKQDASMQWQRCADLPVGTYNAQAVILGDKVYVGGGTLKFRTESPPYIYVYDTTKDMWQLLESPCNNGALAVYHDQLVVAGGVLGYSNVTGKVWVLDEKEHVWTEGIPPMPTARCDAAAMGIDEYLTVLGGSCEGVSSCSGSINVVEIYDGHQWMKTDPLPVRCHNLWSVYHNGFCFIMGGEGQHNSVFYASFESLIGKAKNPSVGPPAWKKLPNVPYTASSPAIFGGSLLAIGGHDGPQKQKTIHMFLPIPRSWIQIAEMPIAVDCTCAVGLPWGELVIIGGHKKGEVQEFIHEVYKANLKFQ